MTITQRLVQVHQPASKEVKSNQTLESVAVNSQIAVVKELAQIAVYATEIFQSG